MPGRCNAFRANLHTMKLDLTPETQIEHEIKVPIEHRHLGTFRRKIKNGIVYEFNLDTEEYGEAKYEPSDIISADGTPENGRMIVVPNCIYVEAINLKNAIRKFNNDNIMFKS